MFEVQPFLLEQRTNMGIRGLQQWIRWVAPTSIQSPEWTSLSHTCIGIDILGFLYRAKSRGMYPIVYVAHLIAMCRRLEIEPIIIFDGKPPSEKQSTLEQRTALRAESNIKKTAILQTSNPDVSMVKELQKLELNSTYFTSEERDQVKQFLYSCGVLSLNASGEADNTLAYFSRKGWISAVISSDFDLLPRGVELLIVPTSDGLPNENSGWKQYTLSNILQLSDMSYNQFVEMCVLMGSDYTSNMRSIPYKSAYWTVKRPGSMEYTLARYNIRDFAPYNRAKQILMGSTDTESSLMNEKQWEKWQAGSPQIELDVLLEFARLYLDTSISPDTEVPTNVLISGNSLLNDLSQHTGTARNYATSCAA
jgi:flap endonuclease-1